MVVNINAEISNYKERVVGNYTLRQVICLVLSLTIGVITYFSLNVSKDIKQFIVIITVLPAIAVGFYTYQGVTFEKYIFYIIREFVLPQKRPFISEYDNVKYKIEEEETINDKKYPQKAKSKKSKTI